MISDDLAKLAPSNFYLQPGPDSAESIIAGVERGLYVTNTMNVGAIGSPTIRVEGMMVAGRD